MCIYIYICRSARVQVDISTEGRPQMGNIKIPKLINATADFDAHIYRATGPVYTYIAVAPARTRVNKGPVQVLVTFIRLFGARPSGTCSSSVMYDWRVRSVTHGHRTKYANRFTAVLSAQRRAT